jgi:hypothetical protein
LVANAYENVLLRRLGRKVVRNPKHDYFEAPVVEETEYPTTNPNLPPKSTPAQSAPKPPTKHTTSYSHYFRDDEDEELSAMDLDSLNDQKPLAVKSALHQKLPLVSSPQPSTSKGFVSFRETSRVSASSREPSPKRSRMTDSTTIKARRMRVCDPNYPFKIENTSLITVDQYLELSRDERSGKSFVIYGRIDSFVSEFEATDAGYSFDCRVVDDYSRGQLKTAINKTWLREVAGIDASEYLDILEACKADENKDLTTETVG